MAAVASRYARALADVVFGLKLDGQQAAAQVRSVVQLLDSSLDLRRVWENPAIPAEQKHKLLDSIAQRAGWSKPIRNFVAVVIDHRRLRLLPDITRQFERELNSRLGFTDAEVTSARELLPAEKRGVEAEIEQMTGKKVRAQYAVDRKLLGGAIIKLGSTIYDGSIRGQLHKIKEQLSSS